MSLYLINPELPSASYYGAEVCTDRADPVALMADLATAYRQRGRVVIMGGPFASLCAEAGVMQIYVGIESPNQESLKETGKRQNVGVDMVALVDSFVAQGIAVKSSPMIGFDSDGPYIFEQHYQFAQELAAQVLFPVAVMAPAAAPLFDRMREAGRLVPDCCASSAASARTPIRPACRPWPSD